MTRHSALLLATASIALAAAMVTVLSRGPSAPRLTSLGTLRPSLPATTVAALPTPVPVIAPAPAPTLPDTVVPIRVTIERIGVVAPVVPTGVQPGTNVIQVPDLEHVGWYRFGPRPGEDGSAVLVGHVDGAGRTGIFWRLRDLTPGDSLIVEFSDGSTRHFLVSGRQEFPKQALPADLFSRQGAPRLTLITCGGVFNRATGHYLDNVVVAAAPTD